MSTPAEEPPHKRRRVDSPVRSSVASDSLDFSSQRRQYHQLLHDTKELLESGVEALLTLEPAVMQQFAERWTGEVDGKAYNRDAQRDLVHFIRQIRTTPALFAEHADELPALDKVATALRRSYNRDEEQHRRAFRRGECVGLVDAIAREMLRVGLVKAEEVEEIKLDLEQHLSMKMGGSSGSDAAGAALGASSATSALSSV